MEWTVGRDEEISDKKYGREKNTNIPFSAEERNIHTTEWETETVEEMCVSKFLRKTHTLAWLCYTGSEV